VKPARKFCRQRLVNCPVHGDPIHAPEGLCGDPDAKMRFSARPGSGMSLVPVGLVYHFKGRRVKSLG
jgi:hypothetical protein